jgi:MoaA/NifB/PqqE/SkfB family radical SAM enzyme
MCHENSTPDGKCGDIMSEGFIDKLHPYTELAIGGGNPLEHPDLVPFLEKCKRSKLIPSMTVNQIHFMKNRHFLKELVEQRLIYGLGISLTHASEEFIGAVKEFPNAVIHVINGIVHPTQLEALANNGFKILILGYKEFRRGEVMYQHQSAAIEQLKQMLYDRLPQIIKDGWFEVVSFDNLAIKQLDAQRLMSNEDWEQFYMGDDGSATMYVDMVNREFAKSSTSTERYPLEDDIVTMFEKIRTN